MVSTDYQISNQGRGGALGTDNADWRSATGSVAYHDDGVATGSGAPPRRRRGRRMPRRELVALTAQLAIMTRSGVDVVSALDTMARRSKLPAMREMLSQIHASVQGGKPFSVALREYQDVFNPTFVASISAGEASGKLPEVLSQLSQLLRSDLRLRNSVRTMMAYPVLLMTVSSAVLAGMILFVLPQFAQLFQDFDTPLPLITQVLISFAEELRTRFWLWLPLLAVGLGGLIAFRFSAPGRVFFDRLVLNVVVLRDVTRTLFIGRVFRLLGLMLDSGVPLLDSLRLAKLAVSNSQYHALFDHLEEEVVNGRGLGAALIDSSFIPPGAAEMVMTAERTGSLAAVTRDMGEFYEEEGESKLRELVTIVEPALTVGMGIVVAAVVLAVMLPMFDMATFAN